MNTQNCRLLFHHHDVVYHPASNEIWISAGIGRWLSALSAHFQEIGLLMHESAHRLPQQDYQITEANIHLVSLGTPGHYVDHFSKMLRIRQICRRSALQADGLLIRGMTPRQSFIWRNTPVGHRAFLLVRSPRQHRTVNLNPLTLLSALINKYREYDFGRIIRDKGVLMANSPLHVAELGDLYQVQSHFVPTNTIRLQEFSPLQVRPLHAPLRLFFCGRLHPLKGVRELFQAVAALQMHVTDCVLDVAGALSEPEYSLFKNQALKLGIESRIRWHGFVPFGPELLELYRAADIFVLPTYTEGFPRVFWEAAASCCPVIITAVGGIPAIVTDEKHALFVPAQDADAIVKAALRIVSDTHLRSQMIQQAYRLAMDFSVESCAKKMAETLSSEWT